MARLQFLLTSLLVAITLVPAASDVGPSATSDGPSVGALGAYAAPTAGEAEIVAEAVAVFEANGLHFSIEPVVSFHDDMTACAGNLGYWMDEEGVDRIRVCWTHEDPGAETILRTQALVHELAHAWVYRNTDASLRAAFVAFVGAHSWNASAGEWDGRGTEIAAELITWAVLDPAVLFVDFGEVSSHRWVAAYELLTDLPAPAPLVAV